MPSTDGMHGERMCFLAIFSQSADEDSRRIQLVAPQFGHQTTTGTVPEPPAAQLGHGRNLLAVAQREFLVTVNCGIDLLVRIPRLPLRQLLREQFDPLGILLSLQLRFPDP